MRCFLLTFACCCLASTSLVAQSRGDVPATEARSEEKPADKSTAIVEVEVVLAEWLAGEKAEAASLNGDSATIAKRIEALQSQNQLTVVQRFRLTTVDGHQALAQQGENRPRVTGVTSFGGGGRGGPGGGGSMNSVSYQATGSLVTATPKVVADDMVVLKLAVERSALVTRPDAAILADPPMGDKIRAESTTTLRLQTTLRLTSGQSQLLAGIGDANERTAVIVTAKIVK